MKKYLLILVSFCMTAAVLVMFSSCKKSGDSNCDTPPATPIAHANTPVKTGDTIRLSCTSIPGASYHWTGPNSFSKDGQDVKIPNSTAAMAGIYSVTASVDGCNSNPGKITIAIFSLKSFNFMGNVIYVYPEDNHTSTYNFAWNNGSNQLTNATNDIDGRVNSNTILGVQGPGDYAAYVCHNVNAFGYTDWYLPSKEELQRMYDIRTSIGNNFTNESYWASSESTVDKAWYLNFQTALKDVDSKYNAFRVRCIRK